MISVSNQRFGHRWRQNGYWFAYAAAGFFLFWQHSGSSDVGLTLTAAWNVSRGLVPYRDFFEFYTPGSFYVLGALFRVFGASYLVAAIAAIVLVLSGGFALKLASRDFLPRSLANAVPFLWLLLFAYYPLINHNTFSLVAAAWAWVALQAAVRKKNLGWFGLAGAAAGATAWMLQTKGAVVVAAALLAMVLCYRTPWRSIGSYLAGLAVSLLPFVYWPLPVLYSTLVAFPLTHYLAAADISFTFLALALAAHGLCGLALWVDPNPPRSALALWWLGAMLYASTVSLPDLHHVISNSWATVPLVLWQLHQFLDQRNWTRFGGVLLAVPPVSYFAALMLVFVVTSPSLLPARQGLTVRQWLRLENSAITELVAIVHQYVPPDGSLFAGPFLPGLYFEARRRNATRFSHLLTSLHPPEFFVQAQRDLAADPPDLVVVNYRLVEKYGYRRANPLDTYLAAHYRRFKQYGDVMVLIPAVR